MAEPEMTPVFILLRLLLAGAIGGAFGYERHEHGQPKALGVAGMMLVTIGSATYMLFAQYEAVRDPSIVGRTIQSILQGIGFLAGAVIFKGGTSVQGIKTATTIWIGSAVGLATATDFWWLGLVVGVATFVILFLTDLSSHRGRQAEDARPRGVSNE